MSKSNEMEEYEEMGRLDREALNVYGENCNKAKALKAERARAFTAKQARLLRIAEL